MAIRTTDAQVKAIIEVDVTISTVPFIEIASSLVDELLDITPVIHDAIRLELIERWLAAHFYAVRDLRRDTEKAGSVSEKFQFKVDLGLLVTVYGQQAIMIDTSGALAALSKRSVDGKTKTVGATWLGTGDSDGNDIST